jgi:hypothetical protein
MSVHEEAEAPLDSLTEEQFNRATELYNENKQVSQQCSVPNTA